MTAFQRFSAHCSCPGTNDPSFLADAQLYVPFNAVGAVGEDFFRHHQFPAGQNLITIACTLDLICTGLIEIIPRADHALQGFFR